MESLFAEIAKTLGPAGIGLIAAIVFYKDARDLRNQVMTAFIEDTKLKVLLTSQLEQLTRVIENLKTKT